ncbi:S-layer homology domain-containing protein [Paenibacillus sp. 1_12]|uniref:S-layer homology domain-containing protein n=1 Tax=Paenibacillus sp. 1_12 TaxID=1566278 RepID=UPI0008E2758E|nr:S-layer homology domain-containing protein [Paenibacillus sp. 1_12]SFM12783.1 S-layer homology domain-containing protein [Paenibacillus sp. 1_12]
MANLNMKNNLNRETNRRNTVLNRTFIKKISAMLSLTLIIAIMVPVLAFAATAGFSSLTYKDGTVTGTVYSDVYADGVSNAVYVRIKGGDVLLTTTKATYSGGNYIYNFSQTISNAYNLVSVNTAVYQGNVSVFESAYQTLYNTSSTYTGGSSSSNGSGGGGGSFNNGTISVSSDGSVDSYTLTNALTAGDVTLKLSGTIALLPASSLVSNGSKTITITNDFGTYVLPVSVLKLDDLAKSLGIEVKDLKIKVTIAKVDSTTSDAVKAAAAAVGGTQLADAVDFNVTAVGKDGKTTSVDFGKTYVSRSVNTSKAVDASKTTGVLYNETTKKVSFVPATFSTVDGKNVATIKRNGNSIYTVVENNKSFADVASHWSKADVELLANKLVVEGSTDTTFEPERNITRAEFAALAVRSLGLTPAAPASTFTDVKSDAWYASTVATATYAGIINGYEDNTFRPDAQITREELAAMVIRAMDYASISTNVSDPQSVLSKFKDSNKIVWAQKEIAAAVNAGIINGLTDDTIGSASKATRAQSATMLKRFLSTANFIN